MTLRVPISLGVQIIAQTLAVLALLYGSLYLAALATSLPQLLHLEQIRRRFVPVRPPKRSAP